MPQSSSAIPRAYIRELLFRLIAIDSRNPILNPEAPGEKRLSDFIAAELSQAGVEVRLQATSDPERPNVIARIPGASSDAPSLMLNGHMDTVSTDGMASPFTPWEQQGLVYGRGSQDMKGSLAVMMAIAVHLVQHKLTPPGDLLFAFVSDEEADSIGTEALVKAKEYICSQTLVLEPTELRAAIAHRGFAWYTVHSQGKAAHGSRYEEGVDAIGNLGSFLSSLHQLAQDLVQRPGSPLVGPPSLHASTIQGGTELSVYPAECVLTLERRTTPEETLEEIEGEIQGLVDRANLELGQPSLTLERGLARPGFKSPRPSAMLSRLDRAYRSTEGEKIQTMGAPFWTDAALLAAAGSDCVLFGPLGFGLHTHEEWVDLESLHRLSAILLSTIFNP